MGKRIKNLGGCRGDGSFYAKLKIQDAWPDEQLCAHVSAVVPSAGMAPLSNATSSSDAASIPASLPASLFPTDDPQIWVLQIPLLDAKEITVDVVSQDPAARHLGSIKFNYEMIKWESRINYRLRKELCAEIRDYERRFTQNHYQPQIMRYLEGDDSIIWRTRIRWQGSPETKPELQVLDGVGNPIAFTQYFFEFQEGVGPDIPHALFVSIELPVDQRYFTLVASDPGQRAGEGVASAPKQGTRENATSDPKEQIQPGFCAINPGAYEAFKYETWKYMKDARADDAAYQQWFKTHCVTKDELARQRLHQFAHEPLISVIVPCFNSQERYLKELLDSVVAQSYPHWELLLVDATCATSDVPVKCAEEYSRKLEQPSAIRHLPLGGEGNIVTNTNYGIEQARGEFVAFLDHDDLLEPDALYHYVEAINNHPNATLLYCDEDLFEKAGTYIQPAFKSKINVDLLYSHNYVTHFLMVRRAALLEEGLSDDAVSGAQDYDVTLKMVRRALASSPDSSPLSNSMNSSNAPLEALDDQLIHIPRILYHWRIHEESTSTGNKDVKPYAERAGQIALQRHLDARTIAACVETTNTPFVYRVRYNLPVGDTTSDLIDVHPAASCLAPGIKDVIAEQPVVTRPIVSVIIPSKDHVDVLDACITSIIERSTFSQFEIIVVENNSTESETFEYYHRLPQYDPRVRVVQWPQKDGNFNYSALINFGASQAQGNYLLLLNNDTEVITPDWIEEMVGYLQRPEVGVVGAKLYFRDHLTQHAGMEVGPFDAVVHVNQDFSSKREGYLAKAVRPGNFSSVTGACQMVSHSLFDELSGYDEALAVGFNDVDFCLRAQQAGYLVTFTPYAELYHYEFVSRGREVADPVKQARWEKERDFFMARWPEPFEHGDPYGNPNLKRNNAYYALDD